MTLESMTHTTLNVSTIDCYELSERFAALVPMTETTFPVQPSERITAVDDESDILGFEESLHGITLLSQPDVTPGEAVFWEYLHEGSLFLIVDSTQVLSGHVEKRPDWATPEELAVLHILRLCGRPVLVDRLEEILHDMEEDPVGCNINIISLRALVMMLSRQYAFADPVIGPDGQGLMYAQWKIAHDGDVVMGFPEGDGILLVAQRDSGPDHEEIDISEQGLEQDIIDKYGYLVPLRDPTAAELPT